MEIKVNVNSAQDAAPNTVDRSPMRRRLVDRSTQARPAIIRGLLVAGVLALAPAASPAEPTPQPAPGKVVQDPAEYNAYMQALKAADPAAKAGAMLAFVASFPNSGLKVDALEQAMAAYQQAGDAANVEAVALRILAIQSGAPRALGIMAFLTRAHATAAPNPQATQALADQAGAYAERGLVALRGWLKPDGMTDSDFAVLRDQLSTIFEGALGYRDLTHKDNVAAIPHYLAALKAGPNDLTNAYQLAIAQLQSKPVDPAGLWWAARAYALAAGNSAAQTSIAAYGKASYRRYHGGDDGWDKLLAAATTQAAPPAGFTVAPAPTAAEIAVKAVADNDPRTLSFSDREFVLEQRDASAANASAAQRVWAATEAPQAGGAKIKLSLKVIAVTPDGLDGALTDDNQTANKTDIHVKLTSSAIRPPASGTIVSVTGRFTGYTVAPFRFSLEGVQSAP